MHFVSCSSFLLLTEHTLAKFVEYVARPVNGSQVVCSCFFQFLSFTFWSGRPFDKRPQWHQGGVVRVKFEFNISLLRLCKTPTTRTCRRALKSRQHAFWCQHKVLWHSELWQGWVRECGHVCMWGVWVWVWQINMPTVHWLDFDLRTRSGPSWETSHPPSGHKTNQV